MTDTDSKRSTTPSSGATFPAVLVEELAQVARSRERRGVPVPASDALKEDLIGLAFSGGGIRSATFNLGVLQALAKHGLLQEFDYISTVSGGGYIGSWLTAWIHRSGQSIRQLQAQLPFQSTAAGGLSEAHPIRFLRNYSNYLTPNKGIATADTGAFLGGYLRNVVLNLAVVIPLFVALLMAPRVLVLLALGEFVCSRTAFILALGLMTLAVAVVARSTTVGGLRSAYCAALVLLGSVLPAFVVAYLTTGLLFCLAQNPGSPYYSIRQCAIVGLEVYVFAWLVAWLFRAEGAAGQFGRRLTWIALLSTASVAGYVGGALLGGIAHLFRWVIADRPHAAVWLVVTWGVPLVMLAFLLTLVTQLGLMGRDFPDLLREWWARAGGYLLLGMAVWIAVFALALYAPWVCEWLWASWQSGSFWNVLAKVGVTSSAVLAWLAAVATGLWAGHNDSTGGKGGDPRLELAAKAAPHLFSLGLLFLLAFASHLILTRSINLTEYWTKAIWATSLPAALILLGISAAISLLASLRIDVNEFSLHHLYRNRLIRCYLGASNPARSPQCFTGFDPDDDVPLSRLCDPLQPPYPGPYPILNATLNVVRGGELALQTRRAKPFIFTPLYSGFDLPVQQRGPGPSLFNVQREAAYQPTRDSGCERPEQDGITLGTAMAISGAAVSPNMGFHTSRPIAFLMTIFDVRLGWWMGNARSPRNWRKTTPRLGLLYLLKELLGLADDQSAFVYLSDGAHFENLALYELVRRRCRVILCSDAGHDPDCGFDDLMNAIEKCRVDFGVEIDLDLAGLRNTDDKRNRASHYAMGTIHYGPGQAPGVLVYLKPSLTGDEPQDVLFYRQQHRQFPHESTGDQWFDEQQFESYRALGEHTMDTYWKGGGFVPTFPPPPWPFTAAAAAGGSGAATPQAQP